jgi:HSP20 family protein
MLVKCHPHAARLNPFFDNFLRMEAPTQDADLAPRCDVLERQSDYVINMEVPGMRKDDLKVEFKDHLLTISGLKKPPESAEGEKYNRTERLYGTFSRSFRVGEEIDATNISAGYHDGVLELVLPKTEKAQPRTVDIRIN